MGFSIPPNARANGSCSTRAYASHKAMSRAASAMPTMPCVPNSLNFAAKVCSSAAGASGLSFIRLPNLFTSFAVACKANGVYVKIILRPMIPSLVVISVNTSGDSATTPLAVLCGGIGTRTVRTFTFSMLTSLATSWVESILSGI